MEITFKGHYTRSQIKGKMDILFNLFHLPHTEDNYNKAGSVLAALAKDSEIEEMQIADYTIRSYTTGMENMKLHEAFALSSTFLKLGEK